jgi:hypothetical protein
VQEGCILNLSPAVGVDVNRRRDMRLKLSQLKRIIREEVSRVVEGYQEDRSVTTADVIQMVLDDEGLSKTDYIDHVQEFFDGDLDELYDRSPEEWDRKMEELLTDILLEPMVRLGLLDTVKEEMAKRHEAEVASYGHR